MSKKKVKQTPNYYLYPLYLIATILPLIMRARSYDTHLQTEDWFTSQGTAIDFFLFYKQWIFVIIAFIIAIMLYFEFKRSHNQPIDYKLFIPLGIYALLSFISTLFSKYRYWGFVGSFEQFENVFCLIGYVLIIFYTYHLVKEQNQLNSLITAIGIGALCVGCIGTLQAFGYNLLNSTFFKQILCYGVLDVNSISNTFGKGRVYATLYNPNYVGVYTAFIIPFFLVLSLYESKWKTILFYLTIIITNIISLFGSGSKSGLLSIIITLFISFVFMRKRLLNRWKITLSLLAIFFIIFFGINKLNNNQYLNAIKRVFQMDQQTFADISSVTAYNDHVEMTFKENKINISINEANILLLDDNNKVIPYTIVEVSKTDLVLSIDDPRFHELTPIVYLNDIASFSLRYQNEYWTFSTKAVPGTYSFYNRYGKFSPIKDAETSLFTNYQNLASGRGFIWARTIPLLKKYLILGSGADSYVHVFPQYDYAGLYAYGYKDALITKPHNIFLQTGVQTGVLSLIALLFFIFRYLGVSFYLYFNNKFTNHTSVIGLAASMATISFLITGLSNDSSITTTPVYVIILSIGLVANKLVKEKNKR